MLGSTVPYLVLVLNSAVVLRNVHGFTTHPPSFRLDCCSRGATARSSTSRHHVAVRSAREEIGNSDSSFKVSRKKFLQVVGATAGGLVGGIPAFAEEEATKSSKSHPIVECKVPGEGKPPNCVSTASVKQVDCYAPPWTYESSVSEAVARVKGVVASDPSLELVEEDDNYLRVRAARNLVADELEFVFNDQDKVVIFKSAELIPDGGPSLSDFGANKSRLETIRKKAGIFDVMGMGLTADSYEGAAKANGPLGQLKAFYGFQSGTGFEDVFEEE